MGKFDLMNGAEITPEVKKSFVTVRDIVDALGSEFAFRIPIYLSIDKSTTFKLSGPKHLDMESAVVLSTDKQRTVDLFIGDLQNVCVPMGALDLPIKIILHDVTRIVRSFKIGKGRVKDLVWVDLKI